MQINCKYMRVDYTLIGFGSPQIIALFVNGEKIKKYTSIDLFYDDIGKDGWEIKGFNISKNDVFHAIFSKQLS